jgi:hypothetical protein
MGFIKKSIVVLALVTFVAVVVVAVACWNAFVATRLWGWFVPLSVPTLAEMIGLTFLVGLLRFSPEEALKKASAPSKSRSVGESVQLLGIAFFGPALTLLLGYLVHLAVAAGY